MQTRLTNLHRESEGFLLLDADLRPIFINRAAAEILSYPVRPEEHKNLNALLTSKIQSTLFASPGSRVSTLVNEFSSGRRRYHCRAYVLDNRTNGRTQASLALLLERNSTVTPSISEVCAKFHLTIREQEVLRHLLVGRTTKEIATGMKISPHTVKAFLRMIMVKMGVSTRSAIVGKALTLPEQRATNL